MKKEGSSLMPDGLTRVYICFGTPVPHLEQIEKAALAPGRFDWWNIVKSARREDLVVFYMIRPLSAFVATAIVDSEVQACPDESSAWRGQPCVWVRDAGMLPKSVPLSEAKRRLPEWKFLRQPHRSTEVPRDYVEDFLRLLGSGYQVGFRLPEEVPHGLTYNEGNMQRILVNRYERDPRSRQECIRQFGARCCLCGFDFGLTYGEPMAGFVHIHHLISLSSLGTEHEVDPSRDLRPVCPNCHAVLHRREPPYSLDEVRQFLMVRSDRA